MDTTKSSSVWSVGVDIIDHEHATILRLIQELAEIAASVRDHSEVSGILASVSAYTEYHFRTEEAVLDAVTHPDRERHKDLHRELKAKTNEYLRNVLNDPRRVDVGCVHDFLRRWWEQHILKVDMAYRPYVENSPVACEAAMKAASRI